MLFLKDKDKIKELNEQDMKDKYKKVSCVKNFKNKEDNSVIDRTINILEEG